MAEQRYRVLERLESGGMAEVFRAEAAGVEGFRKKVAVKRVLPHLSKNQKFISMFLDEARLGARLNHANIVSVLDIGASDDTYFIVMEFIEGANLKALLDSVKKTIGPMPIPEAVYITMEAARGLSYAHELTDDDGNPLHIVHRDVSPPNIMISHRGEIKMTDFGLAKAATQLEKTDPGIVKGKFSYLSPEAAQGEEVDARADVFALGILLWEMLSGERLFLGRTDYDTIRLVQVGDIPSLHALRPGIDAELVNVVMKALDREKRNRYQTAREFGDALAGYLFSHQLKVTSYDLANLVRNANVHAPKPKANATVRINRLIQEELLRFRSIDSGANESLGPEHQSPVTLDGALPLNPRELEDPARWFDQDTDVAHAIDDHVRTRGAKSQGWLESGSDRPDRPPSDSITTTGNLARMLENDELTPVKPLPRPVLSRPAGVPGAASGEHKGLADHRSLLRAPAKQVPPWKYLIAAAMVLGVAAIFLAKFLKH